MCVMLKRCIEFIYSLMEKVLLVFVPVCYKTQNPMDPQMSFTQYTSSVIPGKKQEAAL